MTRAHLLHVIEEAIETARCRDMIEDAGQLAEAVLPAIGAAGYAVIEAGIFLEMCRAVDLTLPHKEEDVHGS